MDTFQVIQPSAVLSPYIRQYWFVTIHNAQQGAQRFVPSGNIIFTITRENPTPFSTISGLSKSYTEIRYSGMVNFLSVVFQPLGAMLFFGIPMCEFHNSHVRIDSLYNSEIKELEQKLFETKDNDVCVAYIESFFLKRLSNFQKDNHNRLGITLDSILKGQWSIDELSRKSCLSYKQFKRLFNEYIGMNPKDYTRIIRFQNLLKNLSYNPQTTLSQLSFEFDYYDKSHLIKEFKEFSGYTPSEYLSVCEPYSAYHSLFRSTFIDQY